MKCKWCAKKVKVGFSFYENCASNLPSLNGLLAIYKTVKKLKRDFSDFEGTDFDEKLDKIEKQLDENDQVLAETVEIIEKQLLNSKMLA